MRVLVLLLALSLFGCGDDFDARPTPTPTPPRLCTDLTPEICADIRDVFGDAPDECDVFEVE